MIASPVQCRLRILSLKCFSDIITRHRGHVHRSWTGPYPVDPSWSRNGNAIETLWKIGTRLIALIYVHAMSVQRHMSLDHVVKRIRVLAPEGLREHGRVCPDDTNVQVGPPAIGEFALRLANDALGLLLPTPLLRSRWMKLGNLDADYLA